MLITNIPAGNTLDIIVGAELIQSAKPSSKHITYVAAITFSTAHPV